MTTYHTTTGTSVTTQVQSTNSNANSAGYGFPVTNVLGTYVLGGNTNGPVGQTTDTVGSGAQTVPSGSDVYSITASGGAETVSTAGTSVGIYMNTSSGATLTDAGSAGDKGDVIYGDSGTDKITVTQGNNYVFAGSGASTIQGGSGADTLWGGGNSLVIGGTGDHQKLSGGHTSNADDTLIAGTGHDITLYAGYGNVVEDGRKATGHETIQSGVSGSDTIMGNGQSYIEMRGGDESLNISDTTAGGSSDTIVAADGTAAAPGSASGPEFISLAGGANFVTLGSGHATLDSGGSDSISLIYGGADSLHLTGASDTVQLGGAEFDDTITGGVGNSTTVNIDPSLGSGTSSTNGASTTIHFSNGSNLTYSGNITITHNNS